MHMAHEKMTKDKIENTTFSGCRCSLHCTRILHGRIQIRIDAVINCFIIAQQIVGGDGGIGVDDDALFLGTISLVEFVGHFSQSISFDEWEACDGMGHALIMHRYVPTSYSGSIMNRIYANQNVPACNRDPISHTFFFFCLNVVFGKFPISCEHMKNGSIFYCLTSRSVYITLLLMILLACPAS